MKLWFDLQRTVLYVLRRWQGWVNFRQSVCLRNILSTLSNIPSLCKTVRKILDSYNKNMNGSPVPLNESVFRANYSPWAKFRAVCFSVSKNVFYRWTSVLDLMVRNTNLELRLPATNRTLYVTCTGIEIFKNLIFLKEFCPPATNELHFSCQ